MDNDNFSPLKIRGSQILGLLKIAVKAIETEGIRLKAQEFSEKAPTAVNKISWLRPANSKIASTLWSLYLSGGLSRLWIETFAFNVAETLEYYAKLKLQAGSSVGAENYSEIRAQVKGSSGPALNHLILDSQESSEFLKTVGTNNKRMSWGGPANFSIPAGAVESSNTISFPHSLGVTPVGGFAGQFGANGFAIAITAKMISADATNAVFRAVAANPMPGAAPIEFTFFFIVFR
jgi:hypothetical protein